MEFETMPSHDNDEPYFFMDGAKFDYKLMYQHMNRQVPVEYLGTNYVVQAGNLDKAIARSLLSKSESLKGVLTTEEFKALVLDINAENWSRHE